MSRFSGLRIFEGYRGAVILVSHDKTFSGYGVQPDIGNFARENHRPEDELFSFCPLKKSSVKFSWLHRNQQKMIEDTEKFIERFRYKATKVVQVQSRIKQLDKLVRIEVEEEDRAVLNLKFPPAPRSGRVVVEAHDSKRYGNHVVLNAVDLKVERRQGSVCGAKWRRNTVKILLNQIEYEGIVNVANVKVGYFAQNQAHLLDGELTVFETIDEIAVGEVRTKFATYWEHFFFREMTPIKR